MKNPFTRRDAEVSQTEANQPDTKPTPLRDTLRAKLKELVEHGDVGALRLAIDHPEMLSELNPEISTTYEAAVKAWDEFLDGVKARMTPEERRESLIKFIEKERHKHPDVIISVVHRDRRVDDDGRVPNPDPLRRSWEDAVEHRLKGEGESIALSGWKRMSQEDRGKLWVELRDGFKLLGAELEANEHQGMVQ